MFDTLISCWSCLRIVNNFTKLMHEGMPNNCVIWENPHLSWGSFMIFLVALNVMSSWVCIASVVLLLFIVFLRCCYVSVDRGVEVQPKFFDISLLPLQQQGKRKSPSLCIILTYVFSQIFLQTISHLIPKSFGQN